MLLLPAVGLAAADAYDIANLRQLSVVQPPFTKVVQHDLPHHYVTGLDVYLVPKITTSLFGFYQVLDGKALGIPATIEDPTNSSTQLFNVRKDGQIQLSSLINGTQPCLDIKDGHYVNGAPVQLWPCDGGDNQKWKLIHIEVGFYMLRAMREPQSATDFWCLTVSGCGTAAGTLVEIHRCTDGENQKWNFVA